MLGTPKITNKKVMNKIMIFCMKINIKVLFKLIPSFRWSKADMPEVHLFACRWTSKFSISWYYHYRVVSLGKPKVPKIISLHYLRKNMLDYLDSSHVHRSCRVISNCLFTSTCIQQLSIQTCFGTFRTVWAFKRNFTSIFFMHVWCKN